MFDVTMTDNLQYQSEGRWCWQYHLVRSKEKCQNYYR